MGDGDANPQKEATVTLYKTEKLQVEGVGDVTVTTIDFPPWETPETATLNWDAFIAANGWPGHWSTITLPDGRQVGHGPENVGETPAGLHASWVECHDNIRRAAADSIVRDIHNVSAQAGD